MSGRIHGKILTDAYGMPHYAFPGPELKKTYGATAALPEANVVHRYADHHQEEDGAPAARKVTFGTEANDELQAIIKQARGAGRGVVRPHRLRTGA